MRRHNFYVYVKDKIKLQYGLHFNVQFFPIFLNYEIPSNFVLVLIIFFAKNVKLLLPLLILLPKINERFT